ncbi:MAG: helix-turn-helix domain-containing protein [Clostridia bacterium]|nr:helix-turn-helix domain-containing protein [Clostridia bacterium]
MHSFENSAAIGKVMFITATRPKNHFYTENAPRVLDRLIYIAKGTITFYSAGQTYTANAGQCVYLPQGLTIDSHYEADDNVTHTFIFERLQGTLWDDIRIFAENPAVIISIHQCVKYESSVTNPNHYLSCLYRIIYLLQENTAQKNSKILPAVELLRREYQKNEPISKYAKTIYMSESQFRKLFREHTGLTPVEYRNQLRLKHVESLLFSGYTVEEAALEAGFNSVSYYCRIAKKHKEKDVL